MLDTMKARMKQILSRIGDREVAWIMLAIFGLVVWGMWGLDS